MSYYCGECAVWAGSSDVNRYGERWCSYSRRYEKSDQNTYGCRGFVYNGRTVLTKVCEILKLPTDQWFEAFDAVKDAFVAPQHIDWLTNYCYLGPAIADRLEQDDHRHEVAGLLMDKYIKPAYSLWKSEQNEQAAVRYREMISHLRERYAL